MDLVWLSLCCFIFIGVSFLWNYGYAQFKFTTINLLQSMLQNHYNIFMVIHLGCPVWSFKGWVGNFYPKGAKPSDFLREYARRLTTIEGNTTFYAVPAPKTIEDWVTATPGTFRFCPKIPKAVSHEGTLKENLPRALEFAGLLRGLGIRLGPMFLQLPPRFSPKQIDDLRTFLDGWPQDLRLAVEVRHLGWFDAPHDARLNELLTEHKMARVTIDTRPIRDLDNAIQRSLQWRIQQRRRVCLSRHRAQRRNQSRRCCRGL